MVHIGHQAMLRKTGLHCTFVSKAKLEAGQIHEEREKGGKHGVRGGAQGQEVHTASPLRKAAVVAGDDRSFLALCPPPLPTSPRPTPSGEKL